MILFETLCFTWNDPFNSQNIKKTSESRSRWFFTALHLTDEANNELHGLRTSNHIKLELQP